MGLLSFAMRSLLSRNSWLIPAGMALGLALFFGGAALPPMLAGLLLFGALALARPDLALLFAPAAATLYLIPVPIPGIRSSGEFVVPLSEVVLAITLAATVANWLWARLFRRPSGVSPQATADDARPRGILASGARYAPHLLFLAAGVFGLLIATADIGAALREFRRMIVEPLIFYAMLLFHLRRAGAPDPRGERRYAVWVAAALSVSGALVALIGLLQSVGLDPTPYLGIKRSYSENVVVIGGLQRVASVYGHPNNLGLYLGRVWPVAAALALALGWRTRRGAAFGLCALLCLGGILVSFSRGAWLGAAAALIVLALPALRARFGARLGPGVVALIVALALAGGLGLLLRGTLGGDSAATRLALWREALALIQRHPLGIGLDQFYWYHNPDFGPSLIDPSLIGTSEQFASHPHNLLLDIWLRMGPLGLLAFAWLLVRFFRAAWPGLRGASPLLLGALAAMTAALIHGLVDNFYFLPDLAIVFWALFALAERGQNAASPSPR